MNYLPIDLKNLIHPFLNLDQAFSFVKSQNLDGQILQGRFLQQFNWSFCYFIENLPLPTLKKYDLFKDLTFNNYNAKFRRDVLMGVLNLGPDEILPVVQYIINESYLDKDDNPLEILESDILFNYIDLAIQEGNINPLVKCLFWASKIKESIGKQIIEKIMEQRKDQTYLLIKNLASFETRM